MSQEVAERIWYLIFNNADVPPNVLKELGQLIFPYKNLREFKINGSNELEQYFSLDYSAWLYALSCHDDLPPDSVLDILAFEVAENGMDSETASELFLFWEGNNPQKRVEKARAEIMTKCNINKGLK